MRKLWLIVIITGAYVLFQPGFVLAQVGGHTPMGSQTPSTFPGDNPNSTIGTNNTIGTQDDSTQAKVDDKKFVKDATMAALTEIEVGKLAEQKASSDSVKQFAQSTVGDQTKLTTQLKQIADNEKVNVPDSLDSKQQSHVDKLAKLSGPEFDHAFLKDLTKKQEQDVHDFQLEAQNGSDANVKAFAGKALPTLQQHLDTAKNLSKEEKTREK